MADDLYLIGATGKSLMIGAVPQDIKEDVAAVIALQFGLTASDVLLIKLEPGIYELNTFLEDFGLELPTLLSARPEEWGAMGLFSPKPTPVRKNEQTRNPSNRARRTTRRVAKTRRRSKG